MANELHCSHPNSILLKAYKQYIVVLKLLINIFDFYLSIINICNEANFLYAWTGLVRVPVLHLVSFTLATSKLVARKGRGGVASGAWPREHDGSNGKTNRP